MNEQLATAMRIFNVRGEDYTAVTTDHHAFAKFGGAVLAAYNKMQSVDPGSEQGKKWKKHLDEYSAQSNKWQSAAKRAGVKLPYEGFFDRFKNRYALLPSFTPEEHRVVKQILWERAEKERKEKNAPIQGAVWTTIGAPGAGKTTVLKDVCSDLIPGRISIGPDEYLNEMGPYRAALELLLGAASTLEERNAARLLAYNAFRQASIVGGTTLEQDALAEGFDVEKHWTGSSLFGVRQLKEGYKAAGKKVNVLMQIVSQDVRIEREAKRDRATDPVDFQNKAISYMQFLPQVLAVADNFVVTDGDPLEPKLVLQTRMGKDGKHEVVFRDDASMQDILKRMNGYVDAHFARLKIRALPADRAPYDQGLDFLQSLAGQDVVKPAPSRPAGKKRIGNHTYTTLNVGA